MKKKITILSYLKMLNWIINLNIIRKCFPNPQVLLIYFRMESDIFFVHNKKYFGTQSKIYEIFFDIESKIFLSSIRHILVLNMIYFGTEYEIFLYKI